MRTARGRGLKCGESLLALLIDSTGSMSSIDGCEIIHMKCSVGEGWSPRRDDAYVDLLAAVTPDVKHRFKTKSMLLEWKDCNMVQLANSELNEKVSDYTLCYLVTIMAHSAIAQHPVDALSDAQAEVLIRQLRERIAGPYAQRIEGYRRTMPQVLAPAEIQFWIQSREPDGSFFKPMDRGSAHINLDYGGSEPYPNNGGSATNLTCDGWI